MLGFSFAKFRLNELTITPSSFKITRAGCLAQLGEHLFDVQKVGGSIPSASTI